MSTGDLEIGEVYRDIPVVGDHPLRVSAVEFYEYHCVLQSRMNLRFCTGTQKGDFINLQGYAMIESERELLVDDRLFVFPLFEVHYGVLSWVPITESNRINRFWRPVHHHLCLWESIRCPCFNLVITGEQENISVGQINLRRSPADCESIYCHLGYRASDAEEFLCVVCKD